MNQVTQTNEVPSSPEPTSPTASTSKSFSKVKFSGTGSEYFNIWIVNLLLSIVTLGIYSAWAKVRSNRYLYSHTSIEGHSLRYLAQPLQILKGRIIGILLFASYFLVSAVSPAIAGLILIALMLASPFLICLSMRFNMRMTAYRNVRFNFTGSYGDAFIVFLLLPIVSAFTLYLAFPWALKKMDEFIHGNIVYGDKKFECQARTGNYYKAAILTLVAGIVLAFAVLAISGFNFAALDTENPSLNSAMITMVAGYFLIFTIAGAIYQTIVRNHLFNSTFIPELVKLESNVSVGSLVVLRLTNFLLLVCTLGLALPWIKIRNSKFFADATSTAIDDRIDRVISEITEKDPNAVAEEVSNIFDMDVGLA